MAVSWSTRGPTGGAAGAGAGGIMAWRTSRRTRTAATTTPRLASTATHGPGPRRTGRTGWRRGAGRSGRPGAAAWPVAAVFRLPAIGTPRHAHDATAAAAATPGLQGGRWRRLPVKRCQLGKRDRATCAGPVASAPGRGHRQPADPGEVRAVRSFFASAILTLTVL